MTSTAGACLTIASSSSVRTGAAPPCHSLPVLIRVITTRVIRWPRSGLRTSHEKDALNPLAPTSFNATLNLPLAAPPAESGSTATGLAVG